MKKAILSSILLLSTTSILANTTMCFKENHQSMSTIENTKLDGGVCSGEKSVNDMKKEGWLVDDIKISQSNSGMNFIYILKQPSSLTTSYTTNESSKEMEARIIANLEKKKTAEENAKKTIAKKELFNEGKDYYIAKCQSCHGTNGEKTPFNTSARLKDLSLEDMNIAIRDYTNGNRNGGNAMIMFPYASSVNENKIEAIYTYLNKLNDK